MTFIFVIEESNIIIQKLYEVTKSEAKNKKAKKPSKTLPTIIAVICLILYWIGDILLVFTFLCFVLPIYFISKANMAKVLKTRTASDYASFLKKNIGNQTTLTIDKKFINFKNSVGERKLGINELKKIIELETIFIIYLGIGHEILIPKAAIENVELCRKEFEEIAAANNFSYEKDLEWKQENVFNFTSSPH